MFVAVSDAWLGIVDGCPVMEGRDVTIGCYGQYDWLSNLLQYNPIVSINSSIHFVGEGGIFQSRRPKAPGPPGPPYPVNLTTTHTFNGLTDVTAGETLNATCQIDFLFNKDTAYSGRNRYADNSLQWIFTISATVNCEYYRFCLATLCKRGGIRCRNSVRLFFTPSHSWVQQYS